MLAEVALKPKEVFGLKDINELPISFDIAWYEQPAPMAPGTSDWDV
jgi:hydroxylamine reductase